MSEVEPLVFHHLVTFGDTNAVGNVYFAKYFEWQGKYREEALARFYPDFAQDFERGFGLITEFAHMDFQHEALLFDRITTTMTIAAVSRTRIEFAFEFRREADDTVLATGRQAVIWTNAQHRPAVMPDALHDQAARHLVTT